MPTYDYECEKCGERFEVIQKMTDDRLTKCATEDCDGKVKRLIGTGAGLLFKGSGFYTTDYRSDSYKAGAKQDSAGSKDSGGDSSSGGDSKPSKQKSDSSGGSKPPKSSTAKGGDS